MQLVGTITPTGAKLHGTITAPKTLVGVVSAGARIPTYTGEYEFTPSEEEQTVNIDGMVADGNITIQAIPNNYGLITYDGTSIRVS